ncbi:MAG: hypothetical protein IT442_15435, partial [Phycisphaeraceae bacterium]|nr:hypothetical protein [Phycisphaeraceae bacterium]
MDSIDRLILDRIQQAVSLVPRPFAQIGQALSMEEDKVLARLVDLRENQKIIRQISAIFDTAALGYASTLVAAGFEDDAQVDAGALIVGQHPGVSHCYRRDDRMQLWYTLAVPPDSRLGLMSTLDRLHKLSGAAVTRPLPTLRLFKIGVRLNMSEGDDDAPPASDGRGAFTEADRAVAMSQAVTDEQKPMIRVLQQDLPLVSEPFGAWAEEAGCSVEALLREAQGFLARRQMRRFAAVLRHQKAGFSANVMGVWHVPTDMIESVGTQMATFAPVSHCYPRPSYPDWPYHLYTIVHASSREESLDLLM